VPVICPLFVGASAGSRDTRILLKTLVEALVEALPNQPNQVMCSGSEAGSYLRLIDLVEALVEALTNQSNQVPLKRLQETRLNRNWINMY